LQELNLRNNGLEDQGVLDAFTSMEDDRTNVTLERLYLTSNQLSDASAECLAHRLLHSSSFPSLNALYLSCNDITNIGAIRFAQVISCSVLPTLKTLDLYRNHIGNRGGQELADAMCINVHVMDLNITYNRITNVTILRTIRFMGKLNRSGRYLLQHQLPQEDTIPLALWSLVLEKLNTQADVRFYFLQCLPELFLHISASSQTIE
jgi:Ran GTPase-activating protein (RanGAP) involved in mRNA processing and transport